MSEHFWLALTVSFFSTGVGVILGMRISAYRWYRYMDAVRRRLPAEEQLGWLQAEDAERRHGSRGRR